LKYVELVRSIVKNLIPNDSMHGYEHAERVRKLALLIAKDYPGTDREVLEIAALLHDIGKYKLCEDHAKVSAEIAREILTHLGMPQEKLVKVIDAIENHSYSGGRRPKTLEGMILSDADKIDALGAIGVARVFMVSGHEFRSLRASINHFYEKIVKLDKLLFTETARRLAKERMEFVKLFLKRIEEELKALEAID